MEKKLYVHPMVTVTKLATQRMLTASNTLQGNGRSVNINPSTIVEGNGSDAATKRRIIWDNSQPVNFGTFVP